MNIFYLHNDPNQAAQYFYDKHKVKMILESAQMLCTAHHALDGDEACGLNGMPIPYKKAHLNHPSSIWVRSSDEHYMWLYEHMLALGKVYTNRYGKTHMSILKCMDPLYKLPANIPSAGFTQPPQCMPDEFKAECSVEAYWNYYEQDKYKIANKNEQKIVRPLNIK